MAEVGENNNSTDVVAPTQPGSVISPGGQAAQPASQSPTPEPTPDQPSPSGFSPDPDEGGLYNAPEPRNSDDAVISWTASEFIAHEKSASWYLGLVAAAVVLAVIIFLLTHDFVSSAVVIVAAILLAIYGSHRPREVEYSLNHQGVSMAGKLHPYHEFRSFSVIPEGAFSSIVLMPLKRFALPLTLYYDPKDEDRIVDVLSDQLPLEDRRPDAIDSLMRRIRF